MDPLTIAGLGISALGSIANIISGESRRSKAQKALNNFKRQELKNVTEGMRVSTLGAELQTQEAQRRFATSVDALRSGGVRGLVGGLGRQEQIQQVGQQQIAADLDRQQVAIERMAAQDEANIRAMREERETAAIRGLGMEVASGRNQTAMGIGGLAQTGLSAASMAKPGGEAMDSTQRAGEAALQTPNLGIVQAAGSTLSPFMAATGAAGNAAGTNVGGGFIPTIDVAAGLSAYQANRRVGTYVPMPGQFGGNPYNL